VNVIACSFGIRKIQTFKKLPIAMPKIKEIANIQKLEIQR